MKTDLEIIKNLQELGEHARQGLVAQTRSDFTRHFNVLTTIRNTVNERYVEDLEQMLRDKLKEVPDPKKPKEVLARHLLIQDIKQAIAKAKAEFAKTNVPLRTSPESEAKGRTAKRNLKSISSKRSRSANPNPEQKSKS